MLRILGISLLVAAAAYVVGVLLGIGLVSAFSGNRHDRAMEAGMTGFFFAGPALAVLGFIGALIFLLVSRGRG